MPGKIIRPKGTPEVITNPVIKLPTEADQYAERGMQLHTERPKKVPVYGTTKPEFIRYGSTGMPLNDKQQKRLEAMQNPVVRELPTPPKKDDDEKI